MFDNGEPLYGSQPYQDFVLKIVRYSKFKTVSHNFFLLELYFVKLTVHIK